MVRNPQLWRGVVDRLRSERGRRLARRARWIVVPASVLWLLHLMDGAWPTLAEWRPGPAFFLVLGWAAVVGALSSGLLSLAWHLSLKLCGHPEAEFRASHALYARTQIARILPGEVARIGRHAFGRRQGIPHGPLAAATALEALGQVVGSGTLALTGLSAFALPGRSLPAAALIALVAGSAGLPLLGLGLAARRGWLAAVSWRALAAVYGLHLGFFAASGAVFVAVLAQVADLAPRDAGAAVAAFAIAWIVAYLTPGNPGGVGTREALLVALLGGTLGASPVLIAALAFRLAGLAGDVLLYSSARISAPLAEPIADPRSPAST